jgi:hypothetical protein
VLLLGCFADLALLGLGCSFGALTLVLCKLSVCFSKNLDDSSKNK